MTTLISLVILAQMMMHSPPVPMTPEAFAKAQPGESVQISVRVDRVQRATLYGEVLRQETDTTSKTSGKLVVLYVADGTPVVMGSFADVVKGAVLFVDGIVTQSDHVDAKRIVVDTKFVKVE